MVKFEEEEKKGEIQPTKEINIEELSTVIGKQEAELEKEKYTPTSEDLKQLEIQLIKLNEQKFGVLEGSIGTDDLTINELEETPNDGVKRLSYLRRDA